MGLRIGLVFCAMAAMAALGCSRQPLEPEPSPVPQSATAPQAERFDSSGKTAAPPLADQLPGLGELAAHRRETSIDTPCLYPDEPELVEGHAAVLLSPAAVANEELNNVSLLATPKGISWAVYELHGRPAERDAGYVGLSLFSETDTQVYIGLSDYDRRAWQWNRYSLTGGSVIVPVFELPVDGDCSSDAGSVYVAVLAYDGAAFQVDYVSFGLNTKFRLLDGFEAEQFGSQDSVAMSWDPVPEASGYAICAFAGAAHMDVTIEGGENTSFVHDAVSMPELPPMPNTVYNYRVWALFPDGQISLHDGGIGRTGLAPPAVWASYRSYLFGNRVRWDAVEGATGYNIYRDDPFGTPVSVDGSTFEHLDFQVTIDNDFTEHTYYVRATDANGVAATSGSAVGALLDMEEMELDTGHSLYGEIGATLLGGRPCFAVSDEESDDCWIEIATLDNPSDSNHFEDYPLHLATAVDRYLGLTELSGFPALCATSLDNRLLYAYASIEHPEVDSDWTTSIASGELENAAGLALVDMAGVPGVVLCAGKELRFHYADDGTPQGPQDWQSHVIFDSQFFLGIYCSALVSDERVMVAYYDGFGRACFATSTAFPPTSSADWLNMTVDPALPTDQPVALALDAAGRPIMAYCRTAPGNAASTLYFAYSDVLDPQGSADWHLVEVIEQETNVYAGNVPSLVLLDDRPAILSFTDSQISDTKILMYSKAMLPEPRKREHWDEVQLTSGIGNRGVGYAKLLGLENGCAAGVYADATADSIELHYFRQIQHDP